MKQKMLVTAALPYANGPIHLGHLIEYIQADIFVRFLKLIGSDALYICASDMHGTPIEINAAKLGFKPLAFANKYWKEHQQDFASFNICFDNYYKTHSQENEDLSILFFKRAKKKGYIYVKEIEQFYDKKAARFLPDRFIKGKCPKCKAEDQYGDACEVCGTTYDPSKLISPRSVITSTVPVLKKTTHYFFRLSSCQNFLKQWLSSWPVQSEIKNWLDSWLNNLQDWCISRDEPYFGFEIPDSKKETGAKKYFYVWLDAPIGYISSLKNYCELRKLNYLDYWENVTHFIGKDIVYFHFLFWPAMLYTAGFNLPQIKVHGFLTVNGKKMSKSRGTFLTAKDFLKMYPPEYLRFYYASYLNTTLTDIDLDFSNFTANINNTLIDNVANFCYRVLSFIEKNYDGSIDKIAKSPMTAEIEQKIKCIKQHYESLNFKDVLAEILSVSSLGNNYFQQTAPWKNKDKKAEVGLAANIIRSLSILLSPILPEFSSAIQQQLGEKGLSWDDISFNKKIKVKNPKILFTKIEPLKEFPANLKVGKVLEVKDHPDADSLYVLQVDLGSEKRQLVAGLKKHISVKDLKDRNIIVCTNLKPAVIRGVQSNGMLLAADKDEKVIPLSAPKSSPGDPVAVEGYRNSSAELDIKEFLKLKLLVKDRKVMWNNNYLKTPVEPVIAGIEDGAKVR